jgi:hypothetical protein
MVIGVLTDASKTRLLAFGLVLKSECCTLVLACCKLLAERLVQKTDLF